MYVHACSLVWAQEGGADLYGYSGELIDGISACLDRSIAVDVPFSPCLHFTPGRDFTARDTTTTRSHYFHDCRIPTGTTGGVDITTSP